MKNVNGNDGDSFSLDMGCQVPETLAKGEDGCYKFSKHGQTRSAELIDPVLPSNITSDMPSSDLERKKNSAVASEAERALVSCEQPSR